MFRMIWGIKPTPFQWTDRENIVKSMNREIAVIVTQKLAIEEISENTGRYIIQKAAGL